jgi:hypothetical protein
LLVGVGLKNFTELRVIEDAVDCYPHPVYEPELYSLLVRDENSREFPVETYVHSGTLAPLRQNAVFYRPLVDRGKLTRGKIGLAETLCVDCSGLLEILQELLGAGITPYSAASRARKHA